MTLRKGPSCRTVGFSADVDQQVSVSLRFVQLTPPGSACSAGWAYLGVSGHQPDHHDARQPPGLQLVDPATPVPTPGQRVAAPPVRSGRGTRLLWIGAAGVD